MPRSRTSWRTALAPLLVAGLLAGACGDDSGSAQGEDPQVAAETTTSTTPPEVQRGGKVVYGLIGETNNWDPTAGNWAPWSLIVANALFDTLARYDADGAVEPYLAEGFYPATGYEQWRIKLREGVTFHNGEPLDAQALADNLEFHRVSPLTGSVFARVTEVEVIDERNVRVALDEPVVQFPAIFTTQVGVMMAPEMIANPDRGRAPIGTGPFRIEEWVPDSHMTLVRNEDYWQTAPDGLPYPYLDELEFRPILDDQARINSLLSGALDVAQVNVPQSLEDLREGGELQVLTDLAAEEDEQMVMFNTAVPPFDDPLAREAVITATDRERFNEDLNDGLAEVAEGPFRTESRWYTDVDYPEYDPDRARELVDEYEAEHGPLRFTLRGTPNVRQVQFGQWLQDAWEQVGIEAELETAEVATGIASVAVGDYQATLWQQFGSANPFLERAWWGCDYVEPIPTVGLNFARNCNEELTDQMVQAARDDSGVELSQDGAAIVASDALKPYYDRVQEELASDMAYLWLFHHETGVVARPQVMDVLDFTLPSGTEGLAFNNGAHPLHQVWLS